MLRWTGLHGETLSLWIEGYESKRASDLLENDEHLVLKIAATNEQGAWKARVACWETRASARFAEWISSVVIDESGGDVFELRGGFLRLKFIGTTGRAHRFSGILTGPLVHPSTCTDDGFSRASVVHLALGTSDVERAARYMADIASKYVYRRR